MTSPLLQHFQHEDANLAYIDTASTKRTTGAGDEAGSITLVFVHGMFCNASDWRFQLTSLPVSARAIAINLRGHGESRGTSQASDADIQRMGKDVAMLADHLDLQNVVLVGHSMGARVIVEANRYIRQRVMGLAMVDGSRFADNLDDANAMAASVDQADFESFVTRMFEQMFTAHSDASYRNEVLARLSEVDSVFGKAMFKNMLNWDATRLDTVLGQAKQPLLIVQSTRIDINRKRLSFEDGESSPWLDYLSGFTTESRIHRLVGVGHFPQVDSAEQFNALLLQFINELQS